MVILLFCMLICSIFNTHAATVTLKAPQAGPNNTIQVGKNFTLEVEIHSDKNISGNIQIENIDAIRILGTPRQSRSSRFVNGAASTSYHVQYQAQTNKEGTITIGPVRFTTADGLYESNTLTLHIIAATNTAPGAPGQSASGGPNLICNLELAQKNPVVGEPLTMLCKVFHRENVLEVGLQPLATPDFIVKQIPGQVTSREELNGVAYNVVEQKYILFPTSSGSKKIGPMQCVYNARVQQRRSRNSHFNPFDDDFFDAFLGAARLEQHNESSNELTVNVQELPASTHTVEGIGTFTSITLSTQSAEVKANEPFLLTLQISGQGNFEQLKAPALKLPSSCKYYESKQQFIPTQPNDPINGRKVFEYVVQAAEPGTFTLTAQPFTFFNTTDRAYQTLNAIPSTITVAPSTHQPAYQAPSLPSTHQQTPEQPVPQVHDIAYIHHEHATGPGPLPIWLFMMLLCGPLLALCWQPLQTLFHRMRQQRAKYGKPNIAKYEKQLTALQRANETEKLYHFFIHFVAQMLRMQPEQITHDVIEKTLEQRGISWSKINEFSDFLNDCASAQFGKLPDQKNLFKQAQYWFLFFSS